MKRRLKYKIWRFKRALRMYKTWQVLSVLLALASMFMFLFMPAVLCCLPLAIVLQYYPGNDCLILISFLLIVVILYGGTYLGAFISFIYANNIEPVVSGYFAANLARKASALLAEAEGEVYDDVGIINAVWSAREWVGKTKTS